MALPRPKVSLSRTCCLLGKTSFTKEKIRPVNAFLGVPYADPPTGEFRFEKTRELTLWNGVREASKYGNICCQDASFLEEGLVPMNVPKNMSEDCLFLNLWTPTLDSASKLPVMLFIHGGGFVAGFSNLYQGTALSSLHDVVVISINYRVGPLGFLSTGDNICPGNYGILDQIEALKWVQKYVHLFGGDSNNVTILGESAGAISVSILMSSPLSKGLFHRGISQSGTIFTPHTVYNQQTARNTVVEHLKEKGLNITSSDGIKNYFKNLSADEIIKTFGDGVSGFYGNSWRPVMDGNVIPYDLYAKRFVSDVDYIVGCNSHEGAMFIYPYIKFSGNELNNEVSVRQFLGRIAMNRLTGNDQEQLINTLYNEYFADVKADDSQGFLEKVIECHGDLLFTMATVAAAEQQLSGSGKTYMYMFDHQPSFSPYPDWVKADHSMDIFYMFGVPFANVSFPQFTSEEKGFSKTWMELWASFAKNGIPQAKNGDKELKWPTYCSGKQCYLRINPDFPIDTKMKERRITLWRKILPSIVGNIPQSKY